MPSFSPQIVRRAILITVDLLLLCLAWFGAYYLRLESDFSAKFPGADYSDQFRVLLPWVVIPHVLLFFAFRIYQSLPRWVSLSEARSIVAASAIMVPLLYVASAVFEGSESFGSLPVADMGEGPVVFRIPHAVPLIYFALSILLTGGLRVSRRLWFEGRPSFDDDAAPTLIVGTGRLAERAHREILQSASSPFRPVCAVSPDAGDVGLRSRGLRVQGGIDDIPALLEKHSVRAVLVAIDDDDPAVLRQVVSHCRNASVEFHLVPTIQDLQSGRVHVSPARRIRLEDLLGREPVALKLDENRNYIRDASVMVTGAGGTIGSEIARQAAASGPSRLVLVGKGENSLLETARALRARHPELPVHTAVADVRDEASMLRVFAEHRPLAVFHAAAHKHVTLMEDQPFEAVRNNAIGTAVCAWLAHEFRAERFVLISSDKAVRPVSVMGATKRIAERIVFSLAAESATTFSAVRFGNVLGSRGSAIPLFQSQIASGGPVTVTHPEATRYFMTVEEAVSLVIQAGSEHRSGSLYLLEMGKPVRILDLVRNMITLSGLREPEDLEIRITGLRPGEKIHEELLTEEEGAVATDIGKVWATVPRENVSWDEMRGVLRRLRELTETASAEEITALLRDLVPDYHPANLDELSDREALEERFRSAREHLEATTRRVREELALASEAIEYASQPELFASAEEPRPAGEQPVPQPDADEPDSGIDAVDDSTAGLPFAAEEPAPSEPGETEAREDMPSPSSLAEAMEAEGFSPLGPDPDGEPEAEPEDGLDLFGELEAEERVAPPDDAPERPAPASEATPDTPFTGADEAPPEVVEVEEPRSPAADDVAEQYQSEAGEYSMPESPATIPFFYLALLEDVDPQARKELFQHLATRISPVSHLVVSGVTDLAVIPQSLRDRTTLLPKDIKGLPAQWNAASREAGDHGILVSVGPEVRLNPDFEDGVRAVVDSKREGLLFYCDHTEQKGAKEEFVKLHDHEGCPHERFEFGPVMIYRAEAVNGLGGFDESLKHAWEYDMHLRLMQEGLILRISDSRYKVVLPAVADGAPGALHSPGRGKLGGFSYVFYPEDVEREVTTVFEKALKEIGAWIDHPAVAIPQPKSKPQYLASVVIPVLNRVKYIANAIDKVREGTFQDFEVVIIDNGSTDGTIEVVEKIAAEDERVRLIHGTGGSIASALNEGIRAAKGKHICQLDSDDQYAPTTLERMIGHLESHPNCGLAISYYRLMDEQANVIPDIDPITHSGYTRNQILRRDGAGALRVFPKAVLEEMGLYDEEHYGNFGEDYDMVVKVGEKYDVDRVHDVLYYYRRHEDNTDVTRDPEMKYKNKNRARQEALRRRIAINEARRSAGSA